MLYEFVLMNSKNHNSDFCNEFIYVLNFCEFMYLNSLEILWFCIISTVEVVQRSFNPAPLLLLPLQDQRIY